jgi:hypothetical protein
MDNVTLAACSYNTPMVTETMLKSFFTHHKECNVLICENSTNEDTVTILQKHKVPFIRNKGGLHSPSVDALIGNCKTDYMLLVDTDVIFLQNHEKLLNQFLSLDLTLMGEICGDRGGKSLHYRVHPWHCFIHVKNIKHYGIKFYDKQRLSKRDGTKIYDVGASFFEDIRIHKLKIGQISVQDIYFKHYEGMSWRTLKYGKTEGNIDINADDTHNNLELYRYGKLIEQMYNQEIDLYKNAQINAKQ